MAGELNFNRRERMRKQIRGVLLSGVLAMLLGVHVSVYASSEEDTAQETRNAITESQTAANLAETDAAYQSTQSDVNAQAMMEIYAEKDKLIAAVRTSIDANAGNATVVASLNRVLNQLLTDYSTVGFTDAFQSIPTTTANNAADQAALNTTLSTIETDLATTKAASDLLDQQLEVTRVANATYAKNNASTLLWNAPQIPSLTNGSPAIVYGLDSTSVYYYVNAGSVAGATVGSRYPIAFSNGDVDGYLEIEVVSESYSVGILVRSTDVTLGNLVTGLTTWKPPTYSYSYNGSGYVDYSNYDRYYQYRNY